MREINVELITEAIKNLSIEANYFLGLDINDALLNAKKEETMEISIRCFR